MLFFLYFISQSLRKVGQDPIVLLMCVTVFLSYLPEAGQYSCMFLYLKQVSVFISTVEEITVKISNIKFLGAYGNNND